jgi:hypothetical protein
MRNGDCPRRLLTLRDIDATRMARGLYQGGFKKYEDCAISIKGLDLVVLLAPDTGVEIVRPESIVVDLQDDMTRSFARNKDLQQVGMLHDLAVDLANDIRNGAKVLVACREGRNRSGLVTALTLHELGMRGPKLVSHIRSRRRTAFGNQAFARYVSQLP